MPLLRALAMVCVLTASCASHEAIGPSAPPLPASFDAALIARGELLAGIGNCVTCHTAPEGRPYAGGFPLRTPYGTVYGTNITPHPETGIGRWSLAAFTRAMREGLDREGQHLYPAFPYDHFTKTSDEDVRALYAFFMTREPVDASTPANTVIVPRPLVAIWKSMYFKPGRFQPEPARDARWNRGAYLSEGLGHCSACHTPRNKLGAEKKGEEYDGGEVGGWHAPALNARSPSPLPWTREALEDYLRNGIASAHAIAAGPMANVVRNLKHVNAADLNAMALYIESLDTRGETVRRSQTASALQQPVRGKARAGSVGERIYAGACADCHDRGREAEGGALPLPLAIAVTLPTPSNLIHIVRDGIVPHEHERNLWMPGYSGALTDAQVAELAAYVRSMTNLPPWRDIPGEIRKAAKEAG